MRQVLLFRLAIKGETFHFPLVVFECTLLRAHAQHVSLLTLRNVTWPTDYLHG